MLHRGYPSAWLAANEKQAIRRGADACAVPIDITRVYSAGAFDRIQHSAKQAVSALTHDDGILTTVQSLYSASSFNIVAARRRIANAVINAGRYYL